MFYVNRDGVKLSAFRVTAADFNGTEFDGSPFEGDAENHKWLYLKMKSGVVTLVPNRCTDYAVWSVPSLDGERILASPGDYIVYNETVDDVYVCDGRLWTLLMLPVEPIALPEPETLSPSQNVDFADIAPTDDQLMGVDTQEVPLVTVLNDWCDEANRQMLRGMNGPQPEWEVLNDRFNELTAGYNPATIPLPWYKAHFIVKGMVAHWKEENPSITSFECLDHLKSEAAKLTN